MAAIRLAAFTGMIPARAGHLLPDGGAQVATNCVLTSGDIQPLRDGGLTFTTAVPGPIRSIFRISEPDGEAWLAWDQDVHCVRGPVLGLGRYYFSGVGAPRVTTLDQAKYGSGNDYPKQFTVMGVPRPLTKPTISISGSAEPTVSRYYTYTFYDEWHQESAPAPTSDVATGGSGATWNVNGMDAAPPNSGDITSITYSGSDVTLTTSNTHYNRVGERIVVAGVTTVTGVNGTWTLTGVNVVSKTMTFAVPVPPTGTYNNTTDAADTWAREAPFKAATKRVYRTEGSSSQFQLVAEGVTGGTYADTLSASQIPGDELISAEWEMPPADLRGLCLHSSGALVGFSGTELCFSEPYQPHAWPAPYRMRVDYPIVALAVYGDSVAIGTSGKPCVAYGSAPGQMAIERFDAGYPCLTARSMVSTLTGAVYASTLGLVQVSDAGVELISRALYAPEQWAKFIPAQMAGAFSEGQLYFIAQPVNAPMRLMVFGAQHTQVDLAPTAIYTDAQTGSLHYAIGQDIYTFNQTGRLYRSQDWHSKEFVLPEPKTFTAAKVLFDTAIPADQLAALQTEHDTIVAANQARFAVGDLHGSLNSRPLNHRLLGGSDLVVPPDPSNTSAAIGFNLYTDRTLRYSQTIYDSRPFRLPGGYRANQVSVRLVSTCRISSVELAENPTELKRV